jgi:hypothetical protein
MHRTLSWREISQGGQPSPAKDMFKNSTNVMQNNHLPANSNNRHITNPARERVRQTVDYITQPDLI